MNNQNIFDVAILFCIFNRMNCTKRVFEKIREVKPARLYLVSDGARKNINGEYEKVNKIRNYVESHIDWECKIYKNYAENNMGCGKRMSSGISWAFEQEEKLIILEDDCLVNKSFFRYCKELLDLYEENNDVMVISGYNSLGRLKQRESFIFTYFTELWGWATWKRVWRQYNFDISKWESGRGVNWYMKKNMGRGTYEYYSKCFNAICRNRLDTWDYQLQYLIFKRNGLTVIPDRNMVKNIGFGIDATHTKKMTEKVCNKVYVMKFPLKIPTKIRNNKRYNRQIQRKYEYKYWTEKIKKILCLEY